MQLLVVGGGDEAVRKEVFRGVEQDGERVEQTLLMDGLLVERMRQGVSWMRRVTGARLGVGGWVGCVGRGGGEALGREEC